jgi:hypothetical protein
MKLRLFGCAAAYALAGTLCVSAQEAPQSKNKEGASEAAPQAESRDKSPARETKEAPANRSDRAERGSAGGAGADRADRKADKADAKADRNAAKDEGDTKRNRADTDSAASKKEKAADKADRGGADKSSNTANDNADAQRDKAAKREGQSETDRSAESKQDSGASKDREQATDRTEKAGADKASKNIQLSADKRDRVQSSLRSDLKLKHETNVDVDISIGARAPRTWAFAPVPVAVVELVPEYRGYVVAYVEDEYVICDPDTYEVVALLPASGGDFATTGRSSGESGAAAQCTTSLTLSEADRDAILNEVQMSDEIDASGVTVGWSVPSDVELKTLPSSIVDRSGALSGCRYFVVDGQVALVNPDQHEVVLLIENK